MATAVPGIEQLYDCATTLSGAKGSLEKHEDEYKTIMAGVKGDGNTKRLASQFIARFFSKFPSLATLALDAILDLCEDDDVNIRKQAIKDLPSLCREMKEFLPKIADVLSQLLQTDDSSEMVVIQNSLMSLFRREAKGTLIGLFSQVRTGGDQVRERVLKFLHLKIKTEGKDLLASKESEAVLLEEIKKSIEDCTADEFHLFMSMLQATSLPKTVSGQSMIVELISHSAQLDKPSFDSNDEEATDRFLQCARAALPFFSSQVKSSKFCEFICLRVLPEFDNLDEPNQTQVLKLLAEICMFTGDIEQPLLAAENVHKRLMESVPTQPEEEDEAEAGNNDKFEFTKVECLLFAFHTVGQQAPQFLTDNPEILKDFKTRLQYFALGIQGYIRKLDEFLRGKSKTELATDENQVKVVAHRSAKNINALIKDLFHTPPSYKTKIIVSWRPPSDKVAMAAIKQTPGNTNAAAKRKSISFEDDKPAKKFTYGGGQAKKAGGAVYSPPQGKYSSNLGRFEEQGGRYNNRRGGRFRGRGRGRKFY